MSATVSDEASDTSSESGEGQGANLRASHLWLGAGLLIALVTVLSGIAATVFQFHDDSEIQREVFHNIPSPLRLAFYTLIPLLLLWGSVQLSYRVKNWERGAPDRRATTPGNLKQRMGDFRAGIYMQTLMREPGAGIMHSLIYFNFLILLAVTTVLEINHQVPEEPEVPPRRRLQGLRPHRRPGRARLPGRHGDRHRPPLRAPPLAPLPDRHQDPPRARRDPGRADRHRGHRLRGRGLPHRPRRLGPTSSSGRSSATPWPSWSTGSDRLSGWHQAWWIAHVLSFCAFLAIIPGTMLRHMFTSP